MEQNNNKCSDKTSIEFYQGFQEWLEINERKSKQRASAITSYLRSLTDDIQEIYVGEEKIGKIYSLYDMLYRIQKLDWKGREGTIKKAVKALAHVYKYLGRGKQYHYKNLPDKKTAFLMYVCFLSEMFYGWVSVSKIEQFILSDSTNDAAKDTIIWQERKSTSKVPPYERFACRYFKSGVFKLIKASGQILPKDFNAVSVILDQYEKILDAAERVYGITAKCPWRATSFISAHNPIKVDSWKLILVNNDNVFADGVPTLTDDVKNVSYDPYTSSLNLYKDDTVQQVTIPVMSGRKPYSRELAVRVIPVYSMSTLSTCLTQIRNVCNALRRELKYYNLIMRATKPRHILIDSKEDDAITRGELDYPDLTEDTYNSILKEALSTVNIPRLENLGWDFYSAFAEYAQGFRIELVAE